MPALRRIDPLPTHELAIRLFYLYDHFRREPVVDSFPDHPQVISHVMIQNTDTWRLAAAERGGGGVGGQTKCTCAESSCTNDSDVHSCLLLVACHSTHSWWVLAKSLQHAHWTSPCKPV